MAETLVTRYLWRGIWRANSVGVMNILTRALLLQTKLPTGASPYIYLTATVPDVTTWQDVFDTLIDWAETNLITLASLQSTEISMGPMDMSRAAREARIKARAAAKLALRSLPRPRYPVREKGTGAVPVSGSQTPNRVTDAPHGLAG